MKYESENITITDQDGVSDEVEEQVTRIKEAFIKTLNKEKIRYDIALSIFATMYARTACDYMELPQDIALEAITKTLELWYMDDFEMEEGQWLN
jgi:hypothetical protein